jgi:adenine-specific DNA-methyltransferase
VRELLDEVFDSKNFISQITFSKTAGATGAILPNTSDFILWYAKNLPLVKYRRLHSAKALGGEASSKYDQVELANGERRAMTALEKADPRTLLTGARAYRLDNLTSQSVGRVKGEGAASWFPVTIDGREFRPSMRNRWKTNEDGMARLLDARRLQVTGDSLAYVRFIDDFPAFAISNVWGDIGGIQSRADPKVYVVQTATSAVERCVLMTTDPGDLVLDPTCGSGTTAYVAEQWGRRWITCDTSRVALALAKQRILTATFPYYQLAHPDQGVSGGLRYSKESGGIVQHIMLESIAKNLPSKEEILYDKPDRDAGKVRVSGPFSVESIPAPSIEDPTESPIPQWESLGPDARADDLARRGRGATGADENTTFVLNLIESLRKDGLTRVGGGAVKFARLNPITSAGVLQAEGELELDGGKTQTVAVSFGPRYGPVTMTQVEDAVQQSRGRYDGVVVLGFTFDAPAQEFLKRDLPVQVIGGYIASDVLVGDLLKTQKGSQLFTLFGQADIGIEQTKDGYVVEVRGVDLYNPLTGDVESEGGAEIAAWFLDPDYDERTFNIGQAFFPGGSNAWEKLQRALKGTIDPDLFEDLRGMRSLPFEQGEQQRAAVKVIDHRGNEMMEVFDLRDEAAK